MSCGFIWPFAFSHECSYEQKGERYGAASAAPYRLWMTLVDKRRPVVKPDRRAIALLFHRHKEATVVNVDNIVSCSLLVGRAPTFVVVAIDSEPIMIGAGLGHGDHQHHSRL